VHKWRRIIFISKLAVNTVRQFNFPRQLLNKKNPGKWKEQLRSEKHKNKIVHKQDAKQQSTCILHEQEAAAAAADTEIRKKTNEEDYRYLQYRCSKTTGNTDKNTRSNSLNRVM